MNRINLKSLMNFICPFNTNLVSFDVAYLRGNRVSNSKTIEVCVRILNNKKEHLGPKTS